LSPTYFARSKNIYDLLQHIAPALEGILDRLKALQQTFNLWGGNSDVRLDFGLAASRRPSRCLASRSRHHANLSMTHFCQLKKGPLGTFYSAFNASKALCAARFASS
jgi:hypothetical protein